MLLSFLDFPPQCVQVDSPFIKIACIFCEKKKKKIYMVYNFWSRKYAPVTNFISSNVAILDDYFQKETY